METTEVTMDGSIESAAEALLTPTETEAAEVVEEETQEVESEETEVDDEPELEASQDEDEQDDITEDDDEEIDAVPKRWQSHVTQKENKKSIAAFDCVMLTELRCALRNGSAWAPKI